MEMHFRYHKKNPFKKNTKSYVDRMPEEPLVLCSYAKYKCIYFFSIKKVVSFMLRFLYRERPVLLFKLKILSKVPHSQLMRCLSIKFKLLLTVKHIS